MSTVTRAAAGLLVAGAILVLVGCAGAGAGAPSASTPAGGGSAPVPTPVASPAPLTDDPAESPVVGGGTGGNPGSGVGGGAGGAVDPAPIDPGAGQPALVVPKPGQLNPRPVAPTTLQASIDGRHVLVKVSWFSGVEPCNVLDSVRFDRSGTTIALTLLEGTSDPNAMCIEIAMLKATIVHLGELEPGTWTIAAADGDAAPLTLTIE
jgi:hypothetical protein